MSLKLYYLNLTSNTLNSCFDIIVSAMNPNKKILFAYNPTSITILSGYINVDDGTIPGFQHPKKNTMLSKPPSSALATCSKVTKPHA